jgi:hypothetical protein
MSERCLGCRALRYRRPRTPDSAWPSPICTQRSLLVLLTWNQGAKTTASPAPYRLRLEGLVVSKLGDVRVAHEELIDCGGLHLLDRVLPRFGARVFRFLFR